MGILMVAYTTRSVPVLHICQPNPVLWPTCLQRGETVRVTFGHFVSKSFTTYVASSHTIAAGCENSSNCFSIKWCPMWKQNQQFVKQSVKSHFQMLRVPDRLTALRVRLRLVYDNTSRSKLVSEGHQIIFVFLVQLDEFVSFTFCI